MPWTTVTSDNGDHVITTHNGTNGFVSSTQGTGGSLSQEDIRRAYEDAFIQARGSGRSSYINTFLNGVNWASYGGSRHYAVGFDKAEMPKVKKENPTYAKCFEILAKLEAKN